MSELALLGGNPAIKSSPENVFKWPIITKEDEDAVLGVLRRGAMSDTDVTMKFEEEFASWQGTKYALGFCNGTASLQAAMFACKIGQGDEVVCPSVTYWASCIQLFSMGATPVFAEIDRNTLCLDPKDIERCISSRTKAIIVVHYLAHPADMDEIMVIAKKHNLMVIEDVSHAQGGLYKGKKLGTFGNVGAMSLMSGKSFATGEGGMLVTDDREIYERAIAYSHYDRNNLSNITTENLKPFVNLPLGGLKGRMNQLSSAMGRVQIKYYDERCLEIRKAMNYFWDLLEGIPGIKAHRTDEKQGSTMAGWYAAHGLYRPEEIEGLSITRFCQALRAEGCGFAYPGCNNALHTHAVFQNCSIYNTDKPTRIAFTERDVRELDKELPVSEAIGKSIYGIPWFKKFDAEVIEQYAEAFKKVLLNYKELLKDDVKDPPNIGLWYFYRGKDDK
jgi:dTDP-4-amino-4,6-dideoxygalactose transaminase